MKAQLKLPQVQCGLVILDVYKAHRTADVLDEFREAGLSWNMYKVTAPVSFDLSVNGQFKDQLKNAFTNCYGNLAASAIQEFDDTNTNQAVAAVQPDLCLSNLKTIHAR